MFFSDAEDKSARCGRYFMSLFSNCVMAPVYAFLQMRPEGDDLHAIVSQSV